MTKVAVIGAGMVGATTAARVAESRIAEEVCLVDVRGDLAHAMALDIGSSLALLDSDTRVTGGNDYALAAGADVVAITAGRPRQPGQSRADLLNGNAEIIRSVCGEVRRVAPSAIAIVVTNPLDEMTALAQLELGFPASRVMGMAGLLDTARYRHFLAERASVDVSRVHGLTLGSHGETMVPLSESATIDGRGALDVLGPAALEEVVERTRAGGAEVVRLLQTGSAYWAPSAAVLRMVQAIVLDRQVVLPVSALLEGQFGIEGVYLGVPARIGRRGVIEIVEGGLSPREHEELHAAAREVRSRVADLVPAEATPLAPPGSLLDAVRSMLL